MRGHCGNKYFARNRRLRGGRGAQDGDRDHLNGDVHLWCERCSLGPPADEGEPVRVSRARSQEWEYNNSRHWEERHRPEGTPIWEKQGAKRTQRRKKKLM
ncbi:hypothetical protein NDU88_001356 [Pleurodeles waltl]|uniref:Uncharacterized protein n=1 Tax=Pleurodeles waltl TaxID=8319 RepID=A0AAV7P8G9_PLEWA|nr:hypothetical protein NDU88_001356 [Pleurodeles waltl]